MIGTKVETHLLALRTSLNGLLGQGDIKITGIFCIFEDKMSLFISCFLVNMGIMGGKGDPKEETNWEFETNHKIFT